MGRHNPIEEALRRYQSNPCHWLSLRRMGLSAIPEQVFELRDLEGINLSDNNLIAIPERLWDLPNLRCVMLEKNPIQSLPNRPFMEIDVAIYRCCHNQIDAKHVNLTIDLNPRDEDIQFLASNVNMLSHVAGLQLGPSTVPIIANDPGEPTPGIQEILELLPRLESLNSLKLSGFKLTDVPVAIRGLRRLRSLRLNALGLTDLPDWIAELELEHFSAVINRLSSVPRAFSALQQLTSIDLSLNPLGQIPPAIFDLKSLKLLDVNVCDIREIPADILRLQNLHYLRCRENPIESPPPEIAGKGLDAIRNYWRQRAGGDIDYLSEAKLLILGEGGAGKTTLAQKIKNPAYELRDTEPSTEGIDVIRYHFPAAIHAREGTNDNILPRNFQVNIWDFGGQEIYHATHQFFLTKRSVYVLVCDDRKEDTDFHYWLQVVEMLSDGSPLFIVQNEKQDRTRDINLTALRARFPNLRGSLRTNLATNRGLDDLVQAIQRELEHLPHIGAGLPATWMRVREALEQDKRDHIRLDEYLTICDKHGFKRSEDKLLLSGYLHDLGICLHFQDDPLLKNTVVLKPSWGTDAVYRVLDDQQVIASRGHFTRQDLGRIWSEPKYAGMHDELLHLMMKFQLCYKLEPDAGYIAPQLLSPEQPPYPWNQSGGLVVRYEYEFLPKGIITRFIVTMHRLIAGGNPVWKTGAVLERDGTRAEVTEEYSQRRIRVRLAGADPRALLAIIDEQLERLHASFKRLKYERHLPCPCPECQGAAEPFGFALADLIKMAKKNRQIQCHTSAEMVDAAQLVRNILPAVLDDAPRGMDRSETATDAAVPAPSPAPEVFVSYAWNDESNKIVDRLQDALGRHGIRLLRDREEVRYKDSIRDFMGRIGRGTCVVAVISDKYLKSENCMFEMLEVSKEPGLRERIFPIVLPDANVYKATGLVQYISHWQKQFDELSTAMKALPGDNIRNLQDNLDLYADIRRLFDRIAGTLRDMNALTPDQHADSDFEALIKRIRSQLGA